MSDVEGSCRSSPRGPRISAGCLGWSSFRFLMGGDKGIDLSDSAF